MLFLSAFVFGFIVSQTACDENVVCNVNLLWYHSNSTEPFKYQAKSDVSEELKGAIKIKIDQTLGVLTSLDLKFAKNLKEVVMDEVNLKDIEPKALKISADNLTITRNSINMIREDVFNNLTVKHLNLSDNHIQIINPKAFNGMKNLTAIILDHNEIGAYSFDFLNCPKLVLISLQYNFISELEKGIFKNLKDNILSVKLSFNRISSVHEQAFDIKEFHEVHLDHNELPNARLLIKLLRADKVDLSENHIECLPKEFMENGLSKIKVLNLTSNPLNCSCLNDLKKKVKKNIEFQKMSPLVKNINIVLPEKKCDKN